MQNTLVIDPFSGAAGDMLLAALIDAGMPIDVLRDRLQSVPVLAEVGIDVETVTRGHFAARRLVVELPHEHAHRGLGDVAEIIRAAPLGDAVKDAAVDTFTRLAMAEAKVHGATVEEVHFHEVGALDAILDVVGFYVACEQLGVGEFLYTDIVLGSGTTTAAHGEIPVPAPATLELLADHRVRFSGSGQELVTPTAAAIIATKFRPIGAERRVTARKFGYGAGTREREGMPNILRVFLGETEPAPATVAIITSTIDDMSGEGFGYTMEKLFERGALDVYYNAVMMKKNRPGLEITIVCEERDVRNIGEYLMTETTTLGVRVHSERRIELARRGEDIRTELGEARVKIATLPDGRERMSPEYESCKRIAEEKGMTLHEVYRAVERAWENRKR